VVELVSGGAFDAGEAAVFGDVGFVLVDGDLGVVEAQVLGGDEVAGGARGGVAADVTVGDVKAVEVGGEVRVVDTARVLRKGGALHGFAGIAREISR